MEQEMGRRMYNIMKWLEGNVAANMVAINPASWLTNFIPLTQARALLGRGELLRGMWETLKAIKADDGIEAMSSFLTSRRGSDPLVQTWVRKAASAMSSPMSMIDMFTAGSIIRARYNHNIKAGLSEQAAISEADSFAASVMADRSKGSTPTMFNRQNPLTKLFTQFQLEVNNQLSYLFKDIPYETKERGLGALINALLKFFLGAWLYNEVYEYFIGRRPALDPIGILNDTVGDITGYELPNLVELGVGAFRGEMPSFRVEEKSAYETAKGRINNIADQLPFMAAIGVSGLDEKLGLDIDAGRIALDSAIPSIGGIFKSLTNERWGTKKKIAEVIDELTKPASYLALPFGGGQLKKIYQGLRAAIEGGRYTVTPEGEDLLQYPVFSNNPLQAAMNAARAALFGPTSLPTGQAWIESGFKSLGAKETAVYQALTDTGVAGEDAYELLQELRSAEKTDEESLARVQRNILMNSGLSGDEKSIVYYGMFAGDRERELMDELENSAPTCGCYRSPDKHQRRLDSNAGGRP